MKKEGNSNDSWLDPAWPRGDLGVQFNRETQSLQLIRKGAAVQGRGCILVFFVAMFAILGYTFLLSRSPYGVPHIGNILGTVVLILSAMYTQQVDIDTKTRTVLARARGTCIPWSCKWSIPIAAAARFEVRAGSGYHTLYFIPFPDALVTLWNPTAIGTTDDSAAGKAALERLAFGLNRFLDAVRKGEPNLERLAQPAPPGPFKP